VSRTLRAALAVLIVGFATTALFLGRWQLERLQSRRAANAALLEARALPPLELTAAGPAPLPGRRLRVWGSFDTANQLLLRGRVHDAAPGLEVVTAFHLAGSQAVLWVLRGFVTSPDATTIPQLPPPIPGEVTLSGLAFAVPTTADGGQPLIRGRDTTWRRLDQGTLARRTPGTFDSYLLLAGDSTGPGGLPTVEPPVLDDGPHLSYAIQWFGIALAIVAFGIIVLPRGDRESAPPRAAP
jgi:cytochrome oxidase assembly protein ShyY1